jgi:hypothetical protein
MGIAASGALGPIGLIAGALIALIPIAIEVGNKIGAALAGESGLAASSRQIKDRRVQDSSPSSDRTRGRPQN